VGSTLRSAVEGGRVAHAYLLSGPRGVGKTTTARLLAMALNCPDRTDGEPCGVCASCEPIWAGKSTMDVVEMDGASNRGVDDARDLRERAMYAATREDRYRVFILDEAHMLTTEAWNALLKLIEEPPPRLILAFATTEPQKIEQTASPIISRCQTFEFRRVADADIRERLRQILEREGVEAERQALRTIAAQADGGVRDALSLTDQVLSFSGDSLTSRDVDRILGLVPEERYLELLELMAARDRAGVFEYAKGLLDDGLDPAQFLRGLGEALRAAMVLKLAPRSDLAAVRDDLRDRFQIAADAASPADWMRRMAAASDFDASGVLGRTARPRIHLEVLLLRLVSMESTVSLEEVLSALGAPRMEGHDPPEPGPVERSAAKTAAAAVPPPAAKPAPEPELDRGRVTFEQVSPEATLKKLDPRFAAAKAILDLEFRD